MKKEETGAEAVILQFPRRRGRPRLARPKCDVGTPELIMKRLLGETAETLDLCLERELITRRQHWCGIHLRWLYTLRHGAPSVRAIDVTHTGGQDIKQDDPEWRSAREQEYHDAVRLLMREGHAAIIMSVCIYNERPVFLRLRSNPSIARAQEAELTLTALRNGLDILATQWKKPKKPHST